MPYTINGRSTSLGAEPRKIDGQLFVPLHAIVQQLGGQVSWDNESKIATTTIGQWTAPVNLNSRQLSVNNTQVTLSADPFVEEGVMWVPASFFHDAFGYNVQADANSQQVTVSLPN